MKQPNLDNRIGVMSVKHKGKVPFGMQTYFFEDMVKSLPNLSVELFFFSPMDWNVSENTVVGLNYINEEWIETKGVIPEIIYDRAFTSDQKQKLHVEDCRRFLSTSGHIILNPFDLVDLLNNKIEFHSFLLDNKIPTLGTLPFESIRDSSFFENIGSSKLYVKPTFGSKGEGIFVVEKRENGYALYDNLGNRQVFNFYADLIYILDAKIALDNRYFIQEEAKIVLFDDAPFDIRVLVQNYGEKYIIAGKAVRIGQKKSMTSNLNSGGYAIPIEETASFFEENYNLSIDELESQINKLCLDCSKILSAEFGAFCEIGFDILVTKDKGPIIIEGNAKPSRWVFVKMADHLKDLGKDNSYYLEKRKETVSAPIHYASYLLK